jgi:hypothetical protein
MNAGITLEPVWSDDDLLELRVVGSHATFSGIAEIYVSHSDPGRWYTAIAGFPSSTSDSRTIVGGAPSEGYAGGHMRLHFRCTDRLGHSVVDVQLVKAWNGSGVPAEMVQFMMPVEASGVDAFALALSSLCRNSTGPVKLRAAV